MPITSGPKYQDRVKHRTSAEAVVGTVIAKYKNYDWWALDVRTDDNKIVYKTPAKNWDTISTEEKSL